MLPYVKRLQSTACLTKERCETIHNSQKKERKKEQPFGGLAYSIRIIIRRCKRLKIPSLQANIGLQGDT